MAPSGADALFTAIGELDRDRVGEILEADPALARVVHNGETPLTISVMMATSDLALPPADGGDDARAIVRILLDRGAETATAGSTGWTPLHLAGCAGHTDLTRTLLDAGAPPDATIGAVAGATPLSCALFYAHRDTGREIARVERAPDDLRAAAGLDDTAGIDRWLGADGSLRPGGDAGMAFTAPSDGFPPREGGIDDKLTIDEALTWASRNGSISAMELLVERGADVNANPYRGTALLWAIYSDDADAARWLIDHGADVNLRHDFGGAEHGKAATALHLAAQFGCERCIDVLLEAGADLTIEDAAFGGTPAGWAAHVGNDGLAERLAAR